MLWKCTIANSLEEGSEWTIVSKAYDTYGSKRAYLYKQESTAEPATLYNIWIGETQITSNNASGVTGPGISGTVTFECDNSGSSTVYRLYLNNATLTVPIKTSVIFTNIYIEGDNSITSSSGPAIQGVQTNGLAQANLNVRIKESGTQATLHVKTIDGVSSVAKGFGSFLEVGSETRLLTSGPVDYDTSADSFEETYKYRITGKPVDDMTFTTASTVEIWVAGQQVLYDQRADILGDGTISYEYRTGYGSEVGRILTLNGFKMDETYDGHAIIFGNDGVTNYVNVNFTGENIIRCTGYPFYTAHSSSWVNASFNAQPAEAENKITAYCDAPRMGYGFNEMAYNNYAYDGKQYGVSKIDGGHEVGIITPYGFSIGGTEMHERNLSYYEGLAYDADSHTITLDNTTLSGDLKWDNDADLTILLKGSNSIIGNIYTTKYDSGLTLTLAPTEGCSLTLDNSEDYYEYAVIGEFSTLVYDGLTCSVSDAVYKDGNLVDADERNILTTTFTYQEPLAKPYLYVNMSEDETGNPVNMLEISSDNGESTDYYYSIDYADESLEDVPTTKAEPNEDGYVSGIVLAGPCTVTAYAQVGDAKSAEKVGKLFGFETTLVKAAYGTESVALPAIIPAIDEQIEVFYSPGDETIATEADGNIVLGQKIGSTILYANLQMPDIMPSYDILNVEGMLGEITVTVLPPVPSVDLPAGTYNEPQTMTVSSNLPGTISGEIHYYRETAGVVDNDSILYGNTLRVDATCKLYIYTRAMNEEGVSFYSDTLSLSYTVIPPVELDISYAGNSREWATYYADGHSLETPDGLQAYVVTGVGADAVTVQTVDYIPQGIGVLLQRTADITDEPITARAYVGQEVTLPESMLQGTAEEKDVTDEPDNVYVLYNDGFTRATRGSIPAHRAYLVLSGEVAGARLAISFLDDDGLTTAVRSVDNGQQLTGPCYNLNGQRVARPAHGLFILNGRKVIVK